jgi:hypothetical protein
LPLFGVVDFNHAGYASITFTLLWHIKSFVLIQGFGVAGGVGVAVGT